MNFVKEMYFEDGENSYYHPIEFDTEDLKELKQEAIKWVKSMLEDTYYDHPTEIKWIKEFFNLTEEDLK